jgi:hypothetical protein
VTLHNPKHPFLDKAVTDQTMLRFSVPPGERFGVDLEVDGRPFPAQDLVVGAGQGEPKPWYMGDDPLLLGEAIGLLTRHGPPDRPMARLYRIEDVTTHAAEADPEVWERLRALGYVAEE